MEVAQILCMNGGNGETSYAKNSSLQHKIISETKRVRESAIESIISKSSLGEQSIGIADLGCSSGPNALLLISDILGAVCAECKRIGHPLPQVTVFLNDLFSNDFNCIFGSLPNFYSNIRQLTGDQSAPFFISGVPGSFYGRLFPRKSLHFVHSSSSLHWLSQVPAGLDSEANKGKIYISPTSTEKRVLEAYEQQFRNDFSSFIKARSEEMVEGGRMVLTFMGRKTMDPTTPDSCHHWELLAQALMALVSRGLIEEEKVDSFNLPYYTPCIEELKLETEKDGSFIIDDIEILEVDWDGNFVDNAGNESINLSYGHRVSKTVRAAVESMLASHFGGDVIDELFEQFRVMVGDYLSKNRTMLTFFVISFVKK